MRLRGSLFAPGHGARSSSCNSSTSSGIHDVPGVTAQSGAELARICWPGRCLDPLGREARGGAHGGSAQHPLSGA
eukprot:6190411-Alexandrium_andersonii.AAC.1